ncbi:MAG: protein translocase subunit SecD [Nitrospirota bacterium]
MKKGILWKFGIIGVTVILSIVFFLPSTPWFESMPGWWKENLPNKGITLGLDLQGGMHLILEVETEKALDSSADLLVNDIRFRLEEKKIEFVSINKTGYNSISIAYQTQGAGDNIKKFVEDNYPNLSSRSSSSGEVIYTLTGREEKRIREASVDQALEKIRNRIDKFGVAEPTIHRQEANEIVVQLPGVKDPNRVIEIIGMTARLEFKLLDETPVAAQLPATIPPGDDEKIIKDFSGKIPEGDEILFESIKDKETRRVISKIPFLVKKQTMLTGDLLSDARVSIDTRYNEPYVSISFNTTGAKLFDKITAENVKKRLAIILDKNIYSAPVIQERISGGNAQITGRFSMEEAKDLAMVLREGALPAPVHIIQNVTVGPSLGKDSIEAGKIAGIIAIIAVVAFMLFYYRLSGLIADLALFLNIMLLLGAMASLNATLTMPGIAGIILAIGMAVDSNVLMFERIREEIRAGKTPRAAVDSGYHKAFWTIFDSHVTTLITAIVLFQFGTGPIKGFAVTLSLGVSINLFTALIGTKTVFDMIMSRVKVKSLSI